MHIQRKKIIFLTSTAIMVLCCFFFYYSGQKLLTEQVLKELDTVAAIQEYRINDYIENNKHLVHTFSSRLLLLEEIVAFQKNPTVTGAEKIRSSLLQTQIIMDHIQAIYIIDDNGKIIASTENSIEQTSFKNEPFFKVGIKQLDVTTFMYKDIHKVVRQQLVAPLVHQGKVIGVLVIEQSIEPLKKTFHSLSSLGETVEWGLSKRAPNGDALMIVPGRSDTDPDSPLKNTLSKTKLKAPMTQALLKNERVFTDTIDYLGNPVLSATRYIDIADWGLGVKINKSEAFAPIIRLRNVMFLFMGIIFVFGFICYNLFNIVKQPD